MGGQVIDETNLEFDGISDELRVFLDGILQSLLLKILSHVLSQVEDNLSSSGNFLGVLILEIVNSLVS